MVTAGYIVLGIFVILYIILVFTHLVFDVKDSRKKQLKKYVDARFARNEECLVEIKEQLDSLNDKTEFLFDVNKPQINEKIKKECDLVKRKVKKELAQLSNALQKAIDKLFGQNQPEEKKETKKNVK